MSHWRHMLLGLALAGGLTTGCTRPMFVAEKDLQRIGDQLPANLERDTREAITPVLEASPNPPSVDDPDRPPRFLTLQEAIAIGLENGTTSNRQAGSGNIDDTMTAVGSLLTGQSDYIRVLALAPALTYTAIETQLARFDADWITSINWTATDTLQQGLSSFQNGSAASFASSFVKGMPYGGTASVSFLTDYRYLSQPPVQGSFGVLNPSYTAKLVFGIDMPLWKDYGYDINQLLARQPGSSPFSPIPGVHQGSYAGHIGSLAPFQAGAEGILIARIRYDQQKAEFERQINALVLNIEVAYWKLYQAYGNLYSNEEVLRIAHKSWMVNYAKLKAGTKGPGDYYPFLGQYQEFRGERLSALANVIERERNLRGLMGLPIEDGTRLVPVTPPILAQYVPNYDAAIKDALLNRPELAIARENLRVAQYQLIREKNSIKPDLRFAANYSPEGIGTRLDGNGSFKDSIGVDRPTNAFRSLVSDHFNDWSMGLILNVPIGWRAEFANIRAARLNLAQSYYFLKDQEERAKRFVTQQYQDVARWYDLIEMRRAERKAYGAAVEARYIEFAVGKTALDVFLLDMERRFGLALVKEYEAIAEYNNALARLEWGKGTTMQQNNIYLSEGALPACAQVRAVQHEKERTKAFVLCEKPRPLTMPGQLTHFSTEVTGEPDTFHLPSDLPQFESAPPPEKVFGPERLPIPERQAPPENLQSPRKLSSGSGWIVPEHRATGSPREGVPGSVVIEEAAPGTSKSMSIQPSGLPVTMPLGGVPHGAALPPLPSSTARPELPPIPSVPADGLPADAANPEPSRPR